MIPFDKQIRIAVIGFPSSGKSFLLFDLIHAFHHLGFVAQQLPLSYPHSSFGTFFHDAINAETSGMRGTKPYDCGPENHYGAIFVRSRLLPFVQYHVDFLNIPGEAFRERDTIRKYFTLKELIERKKEGHHLFWLSVWKSPSGHVKKLILPKGFRMNLPTSGISNNDDTNSNDLGWSGVAQDLANGAYQEHGKRRSVSGKYVLRHLSEFSTASVLQTIKANWDRLTDLHESKIDYNDYEAADVFRSFYFFTYCQLATDLVICDRLDPLTELHSAWQLTEDVCHFMTHSGECNPHVYLAFRGIDKFMKYVKPPVRDSIDMRNHVYSLFHDDITMQLQDPVVKVPSFIFLTEKEKKHIRQTCGRSIGWGFWNLLNHAVKQQPFWKYRILRTIYSCLTVSEMATGGNLPPHVFFIATPIDSEGRIYKNDKEDVTRFIYEDKTETKSFLRETCADMTHHFCFGSLQLLVDILLQNGVRLNSVVTGSKYDSIKYIQMQPIN
jgi:hypothetical protein